MWIPVGLPGYAGLRKQGRQAVLDARFGPDGWRTAHYVRGQIVSKAEALREYEESYRVFLRSHPEMVEFLTTWCGNVYDDNRTNVYDASYEQPHTRQNHYQDISVRRVIAELVDDPAWPAVVATPGEEAELIDLDDGSVHRAAPGAGLARGLSAPDPRRPLRPAFFSTRPWCPCTTRASSPRTRTWTTGISTRAASTCRWKPSGR